MLTTKTYIKSAIRESTQKKDTQKIPLRKQIKNKKEDAKETQTKNEKNVKNVTQ